MNKIVDCLKMEQVLLDQLKPKIAKLKQNNIVPHLVTILASKNLASEIYVKNKTKKAKQLGINVSNYVFEEDANEEDVLELISYLNIDNKVNGVLVQLPLYNNINDNNIINHINPLKDVDGLHPLNLGFLSINSINMKNCKTVVPCTPLGILYSLQQITNIAGKKILVIGKSRLVGLPVSTLLLQQGATIMVAHSGTLNLQELTASADIIVVAAGCPNLVTHSIIKKDAIIIDVGINKVNPSDVPLSSSKIVGDVEVNDEMLQKAKYITPVPNGIGRLTTTFLMYNTYKLTLMQNNLIDDSYEVFS